MRIVRPFIVCLLTAGVTAFVILSLARAPGGERLASSLSQIAQTLFEEPFDRQLGRELGAIEDPASRALMRELVILQIIEHARQTRLAAIEDGDVTGWTTSRQSKSPKVALTASLEPDVGYSAGEPMSPAHTSPRNRWAMFLCFLLGVIWVSIRRV